MKKLLIIISLILSTSILVAQDGYTHFLFRTGYVYKDAMSLSLGLDFAKKYYSAYEVTATYKKSFSDNITYETIFNEADSTYTKRQINHAYENLLLGVQYKPLLIRSKNTTMKFRFGAFLGTDFNNFIASPNIGFELLQSISQRVDLSFTNNNGYFFWAERPTRWRVTAEVGIRLAL